jgi:penicillin-binding protein 1A
MAAGAGGPLGIVAVRDGETYNDGDPVPDQTGASGENEVVAKQVIDPAVAGTVKDVLSTVVTSGTGENAATGEPTWGKTGTTDDNGDAWFCGATQDITACVWVGHAEGNTPMLTEFAGAPVDGGTFPALIFADIVNAYEEVESARKSGEEFDEDATAPVVTDEVVEPAVESSGAVEEASGGGSEPAAPAGEAGGAAGGTAAPSGGGISAG